tara:strand:- start:79 stop:276 length:198 start_codon:yes stop_codon:yes gene_type:complete
MNKNITEKDLNKIKQDILNSKKLLLNLRFQKSTGQLEKTAEIKKERQKIARLKTNLSKINGENNA